MPDRFSLAPRLPHPRLALLLVGLIVAACGGGLGGPSAPTVADAWVRPPMGADRPAAGYLVITAPAGDGDVLVGAASPIAATVEIHETMAGASGMMAMHPIDRLEIGAGATVRLEPGGYHLMLMGITDMPAVGSTVELTLTFERAGELVVQAEVRAG